jgi:hypothetical protein
VDIVFFYLESKLCEQKQVIPGSAKIQSFLATLSHKALILSVQSLSFKIEFFRHSWYIYRLHNLIFIELFIEHSVKSLCSCDVKTPLRFTLDVLWHSHSIYRIGNEILKIAWLKPHLLLYFSLIFFGSFCKEIKFGLILR